jgi:hypothetical protein
MDISFAYPSGEEGGNLLVQMISTCLRCARGGGGVSTLWSVQMMIEAYCLVVTFQCIRKNKYLKNRVGQTLQNVGVEMYSML